MPKENKVTAQSIRDLCKEIASEAGHLLVCDNDAICIYQDLIGHAAVEENIELANDPALMESFYRIYGVAYGTTAAIKYYLNNSDKILEMKADLDYNKDKIAQLDSQLETERKTVKFWNDKADEYREKLNESKQDMDGTIKALEMVRKENIELKAKLYDLQNTIMEMEKLQKEKSN